MGLDAAIGCKIVCSFPVHLLIDAFSYVVTCDWQNAGLIGPQTISNVTLDSVIQYNWSRNQAPVYLEIKQGTFL